MKLAIKWLESTFNAHRFGTDGLVIVVKDGEAECQTAVRSRKFELFDR